MGSDLLLSLIAFAVEGLPPDVPAWGPEYRQVLGDYYTHSVRFMSHLTPTT